MSDDLFAYLERARITADVAPEGSSLEMALPWHGAGMLHVGIRVSRANPWHRIEARISRAPLGKGPSRMDVSEPLDLTVALRVLGAGVRLPRLSMDNRWDRRDLLEESLWGYLERGPCVAETDAARAGLLARIRAAGFDPAAEVDAEALRLARYATDLAPETYEMLAPASPAVRAACEAFPMLAFEVVSSDAVQAETFDGDVEGLLLSGGLDRNQGHHMLAGSPVDPLAPHVVDWLRGLRLASPSWDREAMAFVPAVAALCAPAWLPRTDRGLEDFVLACRVPFDDASRLGLHEGHELAGIVADRLGQVRAALDAREGWGEALRYWGGPVTAGGADEG